MRGLPIKGDEMKNSATDRAYAKRTAKALQQQKIWTINRVRGDVACAERLDKITNEFGGIVGEVKLIPKTNTYVIFWWTWTE